jgi:hypothetical protein
MRRFARICGEELISIRSQGLTIELLVPIVARLVRLGKIGPETPLDISGAKVA